MTRARKLLPSKKHGVRVAGCGFDRRSWGRFPLARVWELRRTLARGDYCTAVGLNAVVGGLRAEVRQPVRGCRQGA